MGMFEKWFNMWKRDRIYYDKEKAAIIKDFIDWYVEHYSYADPHILANERDRFIDEFLKFKFEKEN